MIKRYCDRCKKEVREIKKADVFVEKRDDTLLRKEIELCSECSAELKRFENALIPCLIDLKISLYQNFMDFRGNQ